MRTILLHLRETKWPSQSHMVTIGDNYPAFRVSNLGNFLNKEWWSVI